MSPRQAYHRIRRVIQLQWRGIAIVLIITCDIFFAVVFVFQDNVVQSAKTSDKARPWVECLAMEKVGKKNRCLQYAEDLVVPLRTVVAVLVLLAVSERLTHYSPNRSAWRLTDQQMNGIWLLCLLGRWPMVTGWVEIFSISMRRGVRAESAFVEACIDSRDHRGHEMSSGGSKEEGESGLTPFSPTSSGRHTTDYLDEQPCDTRRSRDHVSR